MNDLHPPSVQPDQDELRSEEPPSEIARVIERIGARYIADLRTLSEEFGRYYETKLADKDRQIAELTQHIEAAERERDALMEQIRDLKSFSAQYIANLQALSDELSRRVKVDDSVSDSGDRR